MFGFGGSSTQQKYNNLDHSQNHSSDGTHETGSPEKAARNRAQSFKASSCITTYGNSSSSGGSHAGRKFHNPSFIDVRFNTNYKDMLIIAEDELEESKIHISGVVIVSLVRPLNVKKISMQLVGNFKLDFIQTAGKQGYTTIIKESRPIFESFWPNLLSSSKGHLSDLSVSKKKRKYTLTSRHDNNYMYSTTSNDSSASLNSLGRGTGTNDQSQDSSSSPQSHHAKSAPLLKTSLSAPNIIKKLGLNYYYNNQSGKNDGKNGDFDAEMKKRIVKVLNPGDPIADKTGTSDDEIVDYYYLDSGNYEIPFSIEIPNNAMIPETVEGLQSGSVLYTVKTTVEALDKTKTSHSKYIRIFKTLKVNNWAIHENLYVGQSFPDKLQYDVKLPSRAVPIGGETPILFKIFPFQKNYKIMKITAKVIQYYAVTDQHDQIFEEEQNVLQLNMENFQNVQGIDGETGILTGDVQIHSMIKIPKNLKKITQDCLIMDNNTIDPDNYNKKLIFVRHKLMIRILLMNPAGSFSEINCNLPIVIYVSPYVPIDTRKVVLDRQTKIHFRPNETTPFFKKLLQAPLSSRTLAHNHENENLIRYFPQEEFRAPPTYVDRVFDKIIDGETSNGTSHGFASGSDLLIDRKLDKEVLENINETPSYDETFYDNDNVATQNNPMRMATVAQSVPPSKSSETQSQNEEANNSESAVDEVTTNFLHLSTDLSPRYEH